MASSARLASWRVTVLVLVILAFDRSFAMGQVDPWEFEVYPYATHERGLVEYETLNSYVVQGHHQGGEGTAAGTFPSQGMWYNSLEFTYGLTDRIEVGGYLLTGWPDGHGFWFSGAKYRMRGRLFDEDVLPVNLGWYMELEYHKTPQFDDDALELELRPILEKDFGWWSVILNPIFEKPMFVGPDKNRTLEFGYAMGVYYRFLPRFSPGVEFYGGSGFITSFDPLPQQQHYVFVVAWGHLGYGIEYNIGPGFGLTPNSDHVLLKFNLELERFIGALLGPSPAGAWFY